MRGVTCGPPMINTPEKWPFLHFEFDMPDLLESTDRQTKILFPVQCTYAYLCIGNYHNKIRRTNKYYYLLIYHISDFYYFSPSQIPLAKEQHLDTFKLH